MIDFKKYIKHRDQEKAHALYSPSGMDRTFNCLGSIREIKKSPKSPDNEHSIRGVNAHTLLEFMQHEGPEGIAALRTVQAMEFKKHIDYSSEQHQAVLMAHRFIMSEKLKMFKLYGDMPTHLIERKVVGGHLVDADCSGTADFFLYHEFGILHVGDYKNGKSPVEVVENRQLMTYALFLLDELHWNFSEVWHTIIQPNAPHKSGPIRTWKASMKTMQRYERDLKQVVKLTKKKDAPLVMDSKHCFFCPAQRQCPLHTDKVTDKFFNRPIN